MSRRLDGGSQGAEVPALPAEVHGRVADGFERVADELRGAIGGGGAAFAATRGGEPVVDLWGGVADRASGLPWAEDSRS